MNWFDEQIRERKLSDQELFEESFVRMAGAILGKDTAAMLNDMQAQTENAILDILRYYRIKVTDIPDDIKDYNEKMEYAMRPQGIMRRSVHLSRGWYKDAYGPMLGTRRSDGAVIALLPNKLMGYHYVDPSTGDRVRINKKTAELFETDAICFYRSFPLKALKIRDLLIFMLHTITRADWILIILTSLAVLPVGMLSAKLTQLLYSKVLPGKSYRMLVAMAVFMICAAIGRMLVEMVKGLYSGRTQTKMTLFVEAAAMARILSMPPSLFKEYSSGEMAMRVSSIKSLCLSLSTLFLSTGLTAVFSLGYIGQIVSFAPGLVLPAITVTLVTMIVSMATVFLQVGVTQARMENEAKESGMSYAMITGIQKIKLAGAEKRAFARWADQYSLAASLQYNPPVFLKLSSVITMAISLTGTIVMNYYTIRTGVSLADYTAFNTAYGLVSGAFVALAGIATSVATIRPILMMVKPILDTVPEVSEGKRILQKVDGRIEISHVSFQYQDDMPLVLDDISLKIKAGDYIAIVGETGCGKSTLLRILLGFEKPKRGAVYYDGIDISRIDLRSLRRRIGVVMQNGKLFNGSIFDNIVVSAPWLTQADAWEAVSLAGIEEDIRQMPMGMHTVISEGSGGISGGQKQRLMIARAVAPKPKVLMLDEATSALDNVTQKQVSEALDSLKCTRIVIAHRLSTIRQCNRILLLKDGRIQEDGTYDELIALNGEFARLVERQQVQE